MNISSAFKGLLLSALLFSSAQSHAWEYCWIEECTFEPAQPACTPSGFYLGTEDYYVNLDIKNSSSSLAGSLGVDKSAHLKGFMYGANGGFRYEQPWSVFADVEVNYGQGKLKHSGSYSRYVHEYSVSAVFGYRLGGSCSQPWSVTPYAGIGYLFQNQSLSDVHVAYRYHIYRIPLGLRIDYAFAGCWKIGVDFTAMPQFDPTVKVTKMVGARWNLAKKTDWSVKIPIEYAFLDCPRLSLMLVPFWRQNNEGGSTAKTHSRMRLGLPPQKWNAYGASLDLKISF